jgi:hypothetical protein
MSPSSAAPRRSPEGRKARAYSAVMASSILTFAARRGGPIAASTVYAGRPKAIAEKGRREADTHGRVRRDRVDKAGKITLRYQGRLYSIGIGRTHARTRVIVLVQDLNIRILDAATGELLRELVLDPSKRHQGTGRPPGPTRK